MEAEQTRQQDALDDARAEFERNQVRAQAELERERARLTEEAHQSATQTYAKLLHVLQQNYMLLDKARAAELQAAGAEIAKLRARVAELEEDAPVRFVA